MTDAVDLGKRGGKLLSAFSTALDPLITSIERYQREVFVGGSGYDGTVRE